MPEFRVNSKQIFLTYPQCTLTKDELLNELNVHNVEYYVISSEQHQDGSPHLHAYISLKKKINSLNPTVFDARGFHPNIQSARSKKAVISYVKKAGDYISNILEDSVVDTSTLKRKWGDILKESTNGSEFLDAVKEEYPRDFCLYLNRLKDTAEHVWKTPMERYQPIFTTFTPTTEMIQWTNYINEVGK